MKKPVEKPSPAPSPKKLSQVAARLRHFNDQVWSADSLNDISLAGKLTALYRILTISIKGCLQNKIPMQSAALAYYSLMSLGPVIALALIISGFILKSDNNQGEEQFKAAIVSIIHEVVPQTTVDTGWTDEEQLLLELSGTPAEENPLLLLEENHTATQARSLKDISATLDQLIDRLIQNAANGQAGLVGLSILIVLAVLMISRVENTFNSIWNAQFGRSWKDRFINYFVFIVLTFLLGSASLTMVSASSFAKNVAASEQALAADDGFLSSLPDQAMAFLQGSAPTIISIVLLTLLTTALNKFMPNVRVRWKPALFGGLVAALLIVGNQKLAALYVSKVVSFQSLYGELSIVLILMFGMYLTWLFLLIGGQVSYAVQNVRFLADNRTWEGLSTRLRHLLCLGCLSIIARRFRNSQPAPTGEDLGNLLHVQGSIIAECARRLVETGLVSTVLEQDIREPILRYQPARPLDQLKLGEIREILETKIGAVRLDFVNDGDPALPYFQKSFAAMLQQPDMQITLDALLAQTESAI